MGKRELKPRRVRRVSSGDRKRGIRKREEKETEEWEPEREEGKVREMVRDSRERGREDYISPSFFHYYAIIIRLLSPRHAR